MFYSRESIGALEYIACDRLLGAGHVAVKHVANDAEPLEHVYAAADVHVGGGRVREDGRAEHQQDSRQYAVDRRHYWRWWCLGGRRRYCRGSRRDAGILQL